MVSLFLKSLQRRAPGGQCSAGFTGHLFHRGSSPRGLADRGCSGRGPQAGVRSPGSAQSAYLGSRARRSTGSCDPGGWLWPAPPASSGGGGRTCGPRSDAAAWCKASQCSLGGRANTRVVSALTHTVALPFHGATHPRGPSTQDCWCKAFPHDASCLCPLPPPARGLSW